MVSAVEGWNRSSLQITVIKVINLKRKGGAGIWQDAFFNLFYLFIYFDDIMSEKQHGEMFKLIKMKVLLYGS